MMGLMIFMLLNLGWHKYTIEDDFGTTGWQHGVYMDTLHINGDTLLDLVFSGSTSNDGQYPIFGYTMEDLDLFTRFTLDIQFDPDGLATVDVNKDGLTDIIDGDDCLIYYPNKGGSFGPGIAMVTDHSHILRSIHSCGDVDNDGDVDVVTWHGNSNNLYWVENRDSGSTFIRHPIHENEGSSFFIDVNVDGYLDVMTCSGRWFKNDGHGNFTYQADLFDCNVLGYDLNLDGAEDILRVGDRLAFSLNDGTGNFLPFVEIDAKANTWSLDVGDLECDGDIDIVYFYKDTIFIAFDTVSLPLPHTPAYKISVLDIFHPDGGVSVAIANMDNDYCGNPNEYSMSYPLNDIVVADRTKAVWFKCVGESGVDEYMSGCKGCKFLLNIGNNNGYVVFKYRVFDTNDAFISVFDIAGRRLYEKEIDSKVGTISWGHRLPSGVYFCTLEIGKYKLTKKFFKL